MRAPPEKQIEEWMEGQTTGYFLFLLRQQLDETFKARGEVFFPYEPYKTQEAKAHLLGREAILSELIDAFETQDLSQLEVHENEESIGDPPLRGPGPNQA